MKNLEWKIVPNHPDYKVSNNGDVYSFKSSRILKSTKNSDGYKSLRLDGKSYKIHKLVAITFMNHKSTKQNRGLVIDHIDGDKTNNNVLNLREVSPRKNRANYTSKLKTSSKYTGVCWDKNRSKWLASIKVNGKQKYLGRFTNEYDAYVAYKKAELIYG